MWHMWGRGVVHAGVWWGKLKEREHMEDLGTDYRIILKCVFSQ